MTIDNPYKAPSSNVSQTQDSQPYQPKIFSAQGRIGRLRYLAYGVISYLVMIPFFALAGFLAAMLKGDSSEFSLVGLSILGLVYVGLLVFMFILAKRRLNDLNQSGWLSLLLLIPLVNFIIGLWLIFAPGKKQANNYGPHPIKNPTGIVLLATIVPIIMILGVVAAIAIPAYQDYVERARSFEQLIEQE